MQVEVTEAIVLLRQAKQLDEAAQEARYAACWLLAACGDGWTLQKAAERAGWSKDGLARLVRGIAGGVEDD